MGSRAPLDRQLVEAAYIPFKAIFTGKLRRYFSWRNFIDPFLILIGFFQSIWILIRFWPHVIFSKGGFVSLPVCVAAYLLGRPIIMHESDAAMGLSNRILTRLATTICVSFPDIMKDNPKVVYTGNPVRSSILLGDPAKGYKLTGFRPEKPVLLVWGGSQGAEEINQIVAREFHRLKSTFQIIHITGLGKKTDIQDPNYIQFEYLNDELPHIYAISALVVGRAGANSIFEIALAQKPNILIPLKSAANNHQVLNAEAFERAGASIVLREGQNLFDVLTALWHNPEQVRIMKEALQKLARPHAAEQIASLILKTQLISKNPALNSKH